jgi:hypothetical protein
MKIRTSRLCVQTSVWVLASALCVTIVAGCGGTSDLTSSLGADASVQGFSGTVHGGPNPVANATVTLYATKTTASPSSSNNYGYGVAGQVLGTTTTDSGGNFAFSSGGTTCPAGQQAYIVSAGGKTGANSTNSAAVLMAALGPCSSLVQGSGAGATHVIINEPTTIAATYALSGFMTTTGNGSSTVVNISAPANNNAATAACTTSGTSPNKITTGCAAAGLAHAFLNAANLVNTTTGVAYSTSPSNSTAIVPQMLINTLANSVEACVNSSGSSSSACTTLMTNTTPTQLTSPTAPSNTLQALLYLALYPSQATGCSAPPCANGAGSGPPTGNTTVGGTVPSAATTALYNVAASNAYYAPALTATPLDFTIAIAYPETGALWGSAADINDNIYVYNNTTPVTLFSLSSNGATNWSTAISTSNGCGSFATRCSVSADALGNLWVVDKSGLTQVSTAGVLGTTYVPLTTTALESAGVDVGNNVWLAVESLGSQTGASGIEELQQGASAIIDVNVGGSPEPYACKQPIFDSAGNLWVESDNTGGTGGPGAILMLSDTGSLTSPVFTNGGSGLGNPVFYPGGTATPGNGIMVDPGGNLWYSAQNDLLQIPSGGTETGGGQNYGSVTVEYGPIYEAGVERNAAMDGDGKIVIDATSTGAGYLSVYYPNAPSDGFFANNPPTTGNTGADVYLNPCYVASSTTTCAALAGGQSTIVNNPRSTTIDDSGAIWVPTQSAGFMIQVIGPGAPTWGQKSFAPKALAPNLSGNTTSLRPF